MLSTNIITLRHHCEMQAGVPANYAKYGKFGGSFTDFAIAVILLRNKETWDPETLHIYQ